MTCQNVKSNLENLLLASEQAPQAVRDHVAACESCRRELAELQATFALLDEWEAPEVNPYFPVRMQALLREEKTARPASWLERARARILFGNGYLRPLTAGALGLMLLIGGGTYAGIKTLGNHPAVVQPQSATIRDLQSLDENSQVFQQLTSLDQSDDSGDSGPSGSL
jgi:anti-sigma factor RsiW